MKFKDMTPKQKAEHIWEYYKIHIFAVICTAALAAYLIYRFFINPMPGMYVGIAVYGPHLSAEETEAFNAYLNEHVIDPNLNEAVDTVNFFFTEGSGSEDKIQDSDMLEKFYTYLYSTQLDIFIGTEEDLRSCVKAEFLTPVTELMTQTETDALEEKEMLLYDKAEDDDEEKPYGISLADSSVLKQIGILQDDTYYLGFIPIEERMEKSAKTAKELIK